MRISERAQAGVKPTPKPGRRCAVCGTAQDDPDAKRSVQHLRRYFSLIRATFHHWPEAHARQFASAEELRSFLQMAAGHREVGASIPLAGVNKDRAVLLAEAAIRAAGSYAMPVIFRDQLVIWRPRSIAFGRLSHMQAVDLFQAVEDVIAKETGIDPAVLMRETERAA